MKHIAYIGTDSVRHSRGIYTVAVDSDSGKSEILSTAPSRDSGYLVLSPNGKYLYATVECMVYHGQARAAVAAYRVNEDHSLTYLNEQCSGGQLAAHIEISPDGKTLFVSGYLTGNITIFPIREDGSIAPYSCILQDPIVDGAYPHIHCTKLSPDGRYLCAMEVGTGFVDLYELFSGNYQKVFSFPTGPVRPRHVTFGPDGDMLYVITEISSEIYAFRYQPDQEEKLVRVQTVCTVPEGFQGMSFSAGIRCFFM
jgi:6-phosphogluconolactonase